jgi:hypothetical protein
LNAASVRKIGVGKHAELVGALSSLDVGLSAEGEILLLDCLFEIEILFTALPGLVYDGLRFTIAATTIDKESIPALTRENCAGLELLHRDLLLKPYHGI